MTYYEILQIVTLFIATFSGIIMPIMLLQINRQSLAREIMRQELHTRLDHLDACFDATQRAMYSTMVTREELGKYKEEIQLILTRIREAISNDAKALHDRVMRLEGIYFKDARGIIPFCLVAFACDLPHYIIC